MENFDKGNIDKVTVSAETIVVLFYADWCPFCKAFKPVFESFEGKAGVRLGEAKLNEDENPMWDKFGIAVVPTLIAFQRGKIVARKDGKGGIGLTKSDFEALLKKIA